MHKPSDDAHDIVASMAEEMHGMNEALSELKPDILVLLGDRYEILVAAQVALIHHIPIAHIHGGELTEGAFDDAICLSEDMQNAAKTHVNPYAKANTANLIFHKLKDVELKDLNMKTFYDL